jgi:hypothetical protein
MTMGKSRFPQVSSVGIHTHTKAGRIKYIKINPEYKLWN